MKYLVDTNVISELLKKAPNENVVRWMMAHATELCLSVISIEEMRFGALFMPEGKRKRALTSSIEKLISQYRDSIWAFDASAAERCARFHAFAVQNGRTPAIEDLMIAAIASSHGAPVVTRRVRDFEYLDVEIINPFEEVN